MRSCEHTRWLRLLSSSGHVELESTDRPRRLLSALPHDSPLGMILMIGNQAKSTTLGGLGIERRHLDRQSSQGELHLLMSPWNDGAGRRIIVADGDFPSHNRLPSAKDVQRCHETSWAVLGTASRSQSAAELREDMYHKLLFPHVDVICLFVADLGGPAAVNRILKSWLHKGKPSTSPLRPSLVLVVDSRERAGLRRVMSQMSPDENQALAGHFLSVRIVSANAKAQARGRRTKAVRRELLRALKCGFEERSTNGYLFSSPHFIAFLFASAESVNKTTARPFDFITASRKGNEVSEDLASHLTNFLKHHAGTATVHAALRLVASSFILDNYPPHMHGRSSCSLYAGRDSPDVSI